MQNQCDDAQVYFNVELLSRLKKTAGILQTLMRQPTESKLNAMKRKLATDNLKAQHAEYDDI